ncbi:MAG: hypothetical protein ABIK86_07710, partial [candidate division WOR-3 bacterium]
PQDLALNTNLNKVYCTSGERDRLTVIDGICDTVIRTLSITGFPYDPVYNPALNKLYVSLGDLSVVSVLDGATDSIVSIITTGTASVGAGLWHPRTNRLFYSSDGHDSAFVVDCTRDEVVYTHDVGPVPQAWCWNRVNDFAYLLTKDTVYALTAAGDSIAAEIPLHIGYYGYAACAVPYPNKVYAFGAGPGRTYVLDCDANEVTDTLIGGGADLLLDSIAGKVYVAGGGTRVYDARADTELARFYFSGPMAWNPGNRKVYIASYAGFVSVLRDTATAVEEARAPGHMSWPHDATVVRNTLRLTSAFGRSTSFSMLDVGGRKTAALKPGSNDLSAVPTGIYFALPIGEGRTTKIVVSR